MHQYSLRSNALALQYPGEPYFYLHWFVYNTTCTFRSYTLIFSTHCWELEKLGDSQLHGQAFLKPNGKAYYAQKSLNTMTFLRRQGITLQACAQNIFYRFSPNANDIFGNCCYLPSFKIKISKIRCSVFLFQTKDFLKKHFLSFHQGSMPFHSAADLSHPGPETLLQDIFLSSAPGRWIYWSLFRRKQQNFSDRG